jgi:hypothetical protein
MNKEVCQRCVNFLENEDETITCDYEFFINDKIEQAILYTPEMFGCNEFETLM